MTELPYRPEHVNDAIANSEELTNEELGAFVRLQRAMWKAGGYLPDDTKVLARFSRAGSRWGKVAPAILRKLTAFGGKISCPELLTVLLITKERRRKRAEAAQQRWTSDKSLETKKVRDASAYAMHEQTPSNHNQNSVERTNSLVSDAAAAPQKWTFEEGKRCQITGAPHDTLFSAGVELLINRVGLKRLAARGQISRWLLKLDDAEALARMLAEFDQHNFSGSQFIDLMDKAVKAIVDEREKGLPLKFGPRVVASGGGNG